MLTLLAPLIGLLGSVLPSIVKLFERRQEIAYQLELTQLQIDAAKQSAEINLTTEAVKADRDDMVSLRSHDSDLDGGKYLQALRASVRPVITYTFFILFCAVKIAAMWVMIKAGLSVPEILKAVWDAETMALFSTIIAFWFGARFFDKVGNQVRSIPSVTVSKK